MNKADSRKHQDTLPQRANRNDAPNWLSPAKTIHQNPGNV
jgi:hypothetical protein